MRSARSLLLLLATGACSVVSQQRVRADYDQVDRTQTVRLMVVVAPRPQAGESVGQLVGLIARRYANHHRDFIVRGHLVAASVPTEEACADGTEGVLHLAADFRPAGDEVAASVVARLQRCRDGEEVWAASGAGSWESRDEDVRETTGLYAAELGEGVRPYVAPCFHLLRAVLDTLPRPTLPDDEAIMEKIELGE